MSTEDNKAIVHRFQDGLMEYFHTGNLNALLETVHPDAAFDMPGMPAHREGLQHVLPMFRSAFPDLQVTVGALLAEGDQVAYRLTWTGTHTGELMGIPATGKRVTVSETHIDQIVGGKIVRHDGDWNQLGMLQQIGALPAMG
ncbi:MAG: hypothetical protein OJF49_000200 [Ktedonobacterales bacterium]|jgi:steroid delta-isomerase-like uncharacterized protein|nr:MAG: hypothetical protein OJF49_000200 [Ktedonobacterales bacterium]